MGCKNNNDISIIEDKIHKKFNNKQEFEISYFINHANAECISNYYKKLLCRDGWLFVEERDFSYFENGKAKAIYFITDKKDEDLTVTLVTKKDGIEVFVFKSNLSYDE